MLRTKIVCTIGPTSRDEYILRQMIRAGMNVARINFSHGEHPEHERNIALIRRLAKEENRVIAIIADLQGPKFRVGEIDGGEVNLESGQEIVLTTRQVPGNSEEINLPHPRLIRCMKPGDRILLDDGMLELEVERVAGEDAHCRVVDGGVLKSNKGIALLDTELDLPSVTDKDRHDLAFAIKQEVDYVAQSFVQRPDDILTLRRAMKDIGTNRPIIAKIEKQNAVSHFDDILEITDGVMVARGDLGIEASLAKVPIYQKRIITKCNQAGKPVITATQMLDSMTSNPRPTRAEVSDVANAVLDGTDAVMLSGETAIGKDPVNVVRTMAHIVEMAEEDFPYEVWANEANRLRAGTVIDAISQTATQMAQELDVAAIICPTHSGHTARMVARYRPKARILSTTPNLGTLRLLALVWGVEPYLIAKGVSTDEVIDRSIEKAAEVIPLQPGDKVVITASAPFGSDAQVNTVQIQFID